MLVTCLFCNAIAFETLPLFLDKLVSPLEAILMSVTLVLIFGEIVPQAICTGPHQLSIAYYMCPVVIILMYCTGPITWPIGKLLDYFLGEHKFQRYDNDQLKKLLMMHSVQALKRVETHLPDGIEGLTHDQAKMI